MCKVNYKKEDLGQKTVKELRGIAKDFAIVGRWTMKKEELIGEIISVQNTTSIDAKEIEEKQEQKKDTKEYIDRIAHGTLVAFKKGDSVLSAKFISRVTIDGEEYLKLETKLGSIIHINSKKILWVKTGQRWPKWIYSQFKTSEKGETI